MLSAEVQPATTRYGARNDESYMVTTTVFQPHLRISLLDKMLDKCRYEENI